MSETPILAAKDLHVYYGASHILHGVSLAMTLAFMAISLAIVAWIFKTGYKLKS